MINQLIFERLIACRERDCDGCRLRTNSLEYHTCCVFYFDASNYYIIISELFEEGLINREQFNFLTQHSLDTFEHGTSTSRLFKN